MTSLGSQGKQEMHFHLEATVVWGPFYTQPNVLINNKLEKSMYDKGQA